MEAELRIGELNLKPGDGVQELAEKKFNAFVRRDVYGPMGRGKLGTKEKVWLGVALVTIAPIRVVLVMIILLVHGFICRMCSLFCVPLVGKDDEREYVGLDKWRRAVVAASGRTVGRLLLFILGFYWIRETDHHDNSTTDTEKGEHHCQEMGRPGVIISNHVSYLDILYHGYYYFPSFIAKRSVAKIPVVGLTSKCAGCVFVERESKTPDFKGVSEAVTERIRETHQNNAPIMMLFPEGTTTNGDFLLPFKTGAFRAKAPVLPVIIKYHYQRFSPAWDSISAVRHMIFLLCQFVNYMEVMRLPVYYPSQQEKDDPKLYAENVRRLMSRVGNLTLSDAGLAEKRMYLAAPRPSGNNSLCSVLNHKDD